MKCFPLFFALIFATCLSAQREDYIALTLRLGEGATTRSVARFDLDVDGGDLGVANFRDGKLGWMPGQQYGLDLRINQNGRVLFSLAGDYFRAVERDFQYAEISTPDGGTIPVTARNDYESFGGSLGLHYRITSPERRADVQLGGNYHYTRYQHDYYQEFTAEVSRGRAFRTNGLTVGENGVRHGLTASARVAYPVFRTFAVNAEARFGAETEQWTFSPVYSVQVGMQVSIWKGI